MLEKSTSDWIRRGKPTRKNMYHHYSAFLNFPPTFACSLIAVFSFLIRFFELVRGNFHGQGCLSIPKRITARRMLGGWSTEWLSSQFFTSVSMLSPTGEGGVETPGICGAIDFLKEFWAKIPTVGPENWSYLIKCPPTSQWIKKYLIDFQCLIPWRKPSPYHQQCTQSHEVKCSINQLILKMSSEKWCFCISIKTNAYLH